MYIILVINTICNKLSVKRNIILILLVNATIIENDLRHEKGSRETTVAQINPTMITVD